VTTTEGLLDRVRRGGVVASVSHRDSFIVEKGCSRADPPQDVVTETVTVERTAGPSTLNDDRGTSSAVVEKLTAIRCARADDRPDYANLVSKLPPRGCAFVPVVRELAAVVRFDADDV
jgi:hypothetical protein